MGEQHVLKQKAEKYAPMALVISFLGHLCRSLTCGITPEMLYRATLLGLLFFFSFLLARFCTLLDSLGPGGCSFSGKLIFQSARLIVSYVPASEGGGSGASSVSMKSVAAGRFRADVTATEERAETVSATGDSTMLYQYLWKLTEVQSMVVPPVSKAHLLLSTGQVNKVTGNTSCNVMNGNFELSSTNGIKFSAFATTRMACIETMDVEKKFLDALALTTNWIIKDTQLVLSNGNTIVAKFKGVKAGRPE